MLLYQIKIHRSQGDFADHIEKIQNIRLQIAFSGLNEDEMAMYSGDVMSDTYSIYITPSLHEIMSGYLENYEVTECDKDIKKLSRLG